MGYEQLTIFDILSELEHDQQVPYKVGQQIVVIENLKNMDIESLYYLKPFIKKNGRIVKVILTPRIHYEVMIGEKMIIVYHEEVRGYITL